MFLSFFSFKFNVLDSIYGKESNIFTRYIYTYKEIEKMKLHIRLYKYLREKHRVR